MATSRTATSTTTSSRGRAGAAPGAGAERKIVTMTGVVTSDARRQTRTVEVSYATKHAKYGKYVRKRTVVQAHDEAEQSKTGDTVEVGPCRPVSKTKTWKVLRVLTPGA